MKTKFSYLSAYGMAPPGLSGVEWGMASVRNFVPFMSGAKNAHKSPFELAGGETFGLPWIQVMNIHNAFLFTPSAF